MREDYYTQNKKEILRIVKKKAFFSINDITSILDELKEENLVSNSLTQNDFYLKLLDDGLVAYTITIRDIEKIRYTLNKEFNIYDFVYSLEKNGFFSMFTSLNIQGLTNFRDNFIFISKERMKRVNFNSKDITQEAIDKAFTNKPRRTKAHDTIYNYNVVILESNNTQEIGIIKYKGYKISSINRAFVEIISNIQYSKTPDDVIYEFKNLKDKLDINEIFNIIEKFDFVYPYYQLAGYYLEKIGFLKEELSKFFNKKTDLIFYTIKNKEKYTLDEYWAIKY
ncbi:hypothetical protein [Aliarcobacter butzleri]|uniref:hypothetical protein n=1 Tax=Aliarcobacter butzleri TaxID=28197 RepID=UPI0021B3AF33|nr:hypothetical protein [Aliarcobacter butzleri]MCT7563043.1 hypothetical protein [Aliarcobacter butzleri]MCT7573670.1 hypothetical protein [Aliarcobacter butzleri]MCT7597824.1 hypothetical protein [Aliarcobacter butzleri]MCT7612636.1 hypothetical protein [Aliarcobacter butzleri]MCT7622715.1 hypothetical protein [Aliarcobacter butzleri]